MPGRVPGAGNRAVTGETVVAAALQSAGVAGITGVAGIAGIAAVVLAILLLPRLTRRRHEKAPADTVPAAPRPPARRLPPWRTVGRKHILRTPVDPGCPACVTLPYRRTQLGKVRDPCTWVPWYVPFLGGVG